MEQFKIPEGYVAWCHLCEEGFKTLDESARHDKEAINKHQRINAMKREKNEPTDNKV